MAKVMVIGGGGREHALVKALIDDQGVDEVICAPGNGGTAAMLRVRNFNYSNYDELISFAKSEGIDLTVVGPEGPLADGIADLFEKHNLKIFGFKQSTARLESSKAFAKEFMTKYGVPTAEYEVFSDWDEAFKYLKGKGGQFFIKADELCGGKGAIYAPNLKEGKKALDFLLKKKGCGKGERVIIERCLKGEEATILAFTDGKTFKVMPPLQDHKPLYDNDQGPNTGGMGSLAPTPLITKEVFKEIEERIIKPTMQGLNKEGLGGAGILYFGLMITPEGSYVLEYNVRFGDPEAQGVLPLLKSDLYPILSACVEGKLDEVKIQWKEEAAVCVIISTKGYPLNYGYERELIEGIEEAEKMKDIIIYHAGTKLMDGKFITHGGRILGVTGVGENIKQAKERAYKAVGKIHFKEMHYRRDIGDKAIKCNSTQT